MASAGTAQHLVRRLLPYPMAAAWHRVTLSVSEAERLQRALLCLETVPRVLVALLLPDYLRGEPVDAVEERLLALRRPSLGQWVGLTRELLNALRTRAESEEGPPPYLPDALDWAFAADGSLSHPMNQLDFLVSRRNSVAHGTTLGGQLQISDQATAFCDDLLAVLATLRWLGRYRVFRVLDQRATRRRTSVGRVQVFQGTEEFTEPVDAEWDAPLLQDAVYLLGPRGDGVLEISPLMQVLADPEAKREHLCLVTAIPNLEKVALAHGSSGLELSTLVETELGPVAFRDWLAERQQHTPYWPCETLSGGLARRAETALEPGTVLDGRFTIVGRLSSSPDGGVYRATDDETGRDVVVRLLALGEDPDAAATELSRLRRLAHPHLVRVDVVQTQRSDGPAFLVMPFVPGPTLEDRMQSGSISRAEATRWSAQILSAVAHLHDAGLVHGRIRPSSFLFDDASILLANLGLKRGASGNEDQRAWLAPEQLRGEGTSAEADRYAAAAVLHALFAGAPPKAGPGQGLEGREGRTLRKLGARDPQQRLSTRNALERLTAAPTGPRPPPGGWPSCTRPMAELLNSAYDLAVAGGHGFLGLEHLVLALRRDARDPGARRLWMLVGDTELAMRSVLAGLTPIETPKEPGLTPRLEQWRDALDDGFDASALEALLREDRGHALHELSAAGALLASGQDGGASTLGIEQLAPMGGPTTLVVVGGPEDGRVLVTSADTGWVGRHDGGTTVVAPLYVEAPCTDRRLSRRHLHWREGAVELRRPAKAVSALGDATLRPGVHTLPAGTLLELTPSTRVRVQPADE